MAAFHFHLKFQIFLSLKTAACPSRDIAAKYGQILATTTRYAMDSARGQLIIFSDSILLRGECNFS
jgi:hypothetical protein